MSFRIPAPSLTNKLLPPCFRKHLSYDTVCRQQNIPLEISFGVSMIFYKVKSWFLWKAWWVLVVYDIAHFQNDNEYSWKNEFYFANPVPPNVCFPCQRLDSERHEKYQHHSWEQKAQKQKAKMKCKKDVYYIVPVLYTISAGDTSTYGANRGCSKPQLSSYACVEPPNHTCPFPPSTSNLDQIILSKTSASLNQVILPKTFNASCSHS
jgi:hypothetical protein